MKWDKIVSNEEIVMIDGSEHKKVDPVMYVKTLFTLFGHKFDIHKFVNRDNAGCFHTHPAYAWRIVLWGGYTEQVLNDDGTKEFFDLPVGVIDKVEPKYCHRLHSLKGKTSWSLWIRGPVVEKIMLKGEGWPHAWQNQAAATQSK